MILDLILSVSGWFYTLLVALGDIALMTFDEYFSINHVIYTNPFNGSEMTIYMGNWFSSDWNLILWLIEKLPFFDSSMYVLQGFVAVSIAVLILQAVAVPVYWVIDILAEVLPM